MTSMQVQKQCSVDISMTQQQTRTLQRGSGVSWTALPLSPELEPESTHVNPHLTHLYFA